MVEAPPPEQLDGAGCLGASATVVLKDSLNSEQRPWSRSTAASPLPRWGITSLPNTRSPTPYSASETPGPFYLAGPGACYRTPNDGRRIATSSGCATPKKSPRLSFGTAAVTTRAGIPARPWTSSSCDTGAVVRPTWPAAALESSQPVSPTPPRPATSLGLPAGLESRVARSLQEDLRIPDRPNTALGTSRPAEKTAGADSGPPPDRPATALGLTSTTFAAACQALTTPAFQSGSQSNSQANTPIAARIHQSTARAAAVDSATEPRAVSIEGHPWAGHEWLSSPPPWEGKRRAAPPPGCLLTDVTNRIMRPAGIWSPQLWLDAREEVLNESVKLQGGKAEGLSRLFSLVRHSTEEAMELGQYKIIPPHEVKPNIIDLEHIMEGCPKSQWFGESNTKMPEALPGLGHYASVVHDGQVVPPPLLICDASPLDIAVNLSLKARAASDVKATGPPQPVVLVVEIHDFDNHGGVDFRSSTAMSPQDLLLRTDLKRFIEAATGHMRFAKAPRLKPHLTDISDPYILHCPDVTVFRGPHEQGYPYLEEPIKLYVIVYALHNSKPAVQMVMRRKYGATEWYVDQADHGSLLERLNLIGMVAHQTSVQVSPRHPILIMTAPGCGGPAHQPRDALANSLKHWRRVFAQFFHSVFICCRGRGGGDQALTKFLDSIINKQVYRICGAETLMSSLSGWNYDLDELEKTVSMKEMQKAARHVKKGLGFASHQSEMDTPVEEQQEEEQLAALAQVQEVQQTSFKSPRASYMESEMKKSLRRATLVAQLMVGQEDDGSSSSSNDDEDVDPPASTTVSNVLVEKKYEFSRSKDVNKMMAVFDSEISTSDACVACGRDEGIHIRATAGQSPEPHQEIDEAIVTTVKGALKAAGSQPARTQPTRGRGQTISPGYFQEHFQMSLNKLNSQCNPDKRHTMHGKSARMSELRDRKSELQEDGKERASESRRSRRSTRKSKSRKSRKLKSPRTPLEEENLEDTEVLERITEKEEVEKPASHEAGQQADKILSETPVERKLSRSNSLPPSARRRSVSSSPSAGSPEKPSDLTRTFPLARRWSSSPRPLSGRRSSAASSRPGSGRRNSEVWQRLRRKSDAFAAASKDWDQVYNQKIEQLKQFQTKELFDVTRPRSAIPDSQRGSSIEFQVDKTRNATSDNVLELMHEAVTRKAATSLVEMVGEHVNVETMRTPVAPGQRRSQGKTKNPREERIEVRGGKAHTVTDEGLDIRAETRRRLSQRKDGLTRESSSSSFNQTDAASHAVEGRRSSAENTPTHPSRPGTARGSRPSSGTFHRRLSDRLVLMRQPSSKDDLQPPSEENAMPHAQKDTDIGEEHHAEEDNEVKRSNAGTSAMAFGSSKAEPVRLSHKKNLYTSDGGRSQGSEVWTASRPGSANRHGSTASRPGSSLAIPPERMSSTTPRGSRAVDAQKILDMALRHSTGMTPRSSASSPRTSAKVKEKSPGVKKMGDVLEDSLMEFAGQINNRMEQSRISGLRAAAAP